MKALRSGKGSSGCYINESMLKVRLHINTYRGQAGGPGAMEGNLRVHAEEVRLISGFLPQSFAALQAGSMEPLHQVLPHHVFNLIQTHPHCASDKKT